MLIDEVRARLPADGEAPLLGSVLKRAVCFDITPIRAYLDRMLGDGRPYDLLADLPNVAPLASIAWFETAARSGSLCTIVAVQDDEQGWDDPLGFVRCFEGDIARARWIVLVQHAHQLRDGRMALPWWTHLLAVAEDGAPLDWARAGLGPPALKGCEPAEELWKLWWDDLYTACTAICFAHCKGVTVTDHEQSRQQRRAAQRQDRPPLLSYKTIDIAPVTRILRQEGQIEATGIKRALHLCRGHFAHYTDTKPLFGRYTGTFYRPMHVRGRPEQGVVVKDYRVLAPSAAVAERTAP